MSRAGTAGTQGRGRIDGLDVARAVAILGMYAIHFKRGALVGGGGDLATLDRLLISGLVTGPIAVSILFVVLMGAGTTLAPATPDRRTRYLRRGGVLIVAGLVLQQAQPEGGVSVILATLGVLALLTPPILPCSDRALLLGAGVLTVAGPLARDVLALTTAGVVTDTSAELIAWPWTWLTRVLVTGPYPVIVMVGPFLLGALLGRRLRHHAGVPSRWIGAAAVVVTVVGLGSFVLAGAVDVTALDSPARFANATIDAKSMLWAINGLAWSLLVVTACLWLTPRVRTMVAFAWMGRAALSLYVLHLLVIAVVPTVVRRPTISGALVVTAIGTVVSLALAALWRDRRAPFEWLLRAATGARPETAGDARPAHASDVQR